MCADVNVTINWERCNIYCTNGRIIKNWKDQVWPLYSTARCTFTQGHSICHDIQSQDLIFFPEICLSILQRDYVKLKALVNICINHLQNQVAFYVATSLHVEDSFLRSQQFLSYTRNFPCFGNPTVHFLFHLSGYKSSPHDHKTYADNQHSAS
jgi:hypothetical protein